MKYAHIAKYVAETPWAILPTKLDEIEAILEFHIGGGKFTAEELQARIGDGGSRADVSRSGAVAVIPVQGVIAHRMGGMSEMSGGVSTERVTAMLKQALADPNVGSILLDVNSPGGTVAGVTELAAEIRAGVARKPITAHVNAMAASAAYWAISGASEIVVTPSGDVGSIGVITAHVDASEAEAKEGLKRTVISAGKYKAEGAGPLTEEAHAAIQSRVDDFYALMTADIAKGRGVPLSEVRGGFGEGRLVGAKEAVRLKMADRIATMDDTLQRLINGRGPSIGPRADAEPVAVEAAAEPVATMVASEADRARRMRLA